MALTVTERFTTADYAASSELMGGIVVVSCLIDFDSSYPTGGEALADTDFSANTQASARNSTILHVICGPTDHATVNAHVVWDNTNKKLIL